MKSNTTELCSSEETVLRTSEETVLTLRATHPEDGRDMLVPITKADIVEIANLFTEAEQRQFLSLVDKKFGTSR